METTLLVDPTHLREAARAQADVGAFVSGMNSGASVAGGGAHVAGLESEGACTLLGGLLDDATAAVHEALSDHSAKLIRAADHYQRADEEFGRRLRMFGS
jgi:hypothetical protein